MLSKESITKKLEERKNDIVRALHKGQVITLAVRGGTLIVTARM